MWVVLLLVMSSREGNTSSQQPPRMCLAWAGTGRKSATRVCWMGRRSYEELSDCTRHVAGLLHCFWPGAAVDKFFIAVHQHYFRNCPVSGRALRDPPSSILYTLIVVPILVTLLVTALVVWKSKHPEGIV
nr:receptor activity-modifying protein 1 isoform X1 [Camelus dromedarius]